jgi:hypothetical protein
MVRVATKQTSSYEDQGTGGFIPDHSDDEYEWRWEQKKSKKSPWG